MVVSLLSLSPWAEPSQEGPCLLSTVLSSPPPLHPLLWCCGLEPRAPQPCCGRPHHGTVLPLLPLPLLCSAKTQGRRRERWFNREKGVSVGWSTTVQVSLALALPLPSKEATGSTGSRASASLKREVQRGAEQLQGRPPLSPSHFLPSCLLSCQPLSTPSHVPFLVLKDPLSF